MIVEWIAWVFFVFLVYRTIVVLINLISYPVFQADDHSAGNDLLLSVLIPVRNEERNLMALFDALKNLNPDNTEIIFYDDGSTDRSNQLIQEFLLEFKNARIILGGNLPEGWIGKNYACHNLAKAATGEYYLFIDADVIPSSEAIEKLRTVFRKSKNAMVSVFPVQILHSTGERFVVPLMNWILITLLPVIAVSKLKSPAFAAANGQFIAFDAEIYRKYLFHQWVRNSAVEDIMIQKVMKKFRLPVKTFLGTPIIKCRMYDGFTASVNGFSKNFFHFFGRSRILSLLFLIYSTSVLWIILFSLNNVFFVVAVLCVLIQRVVYSLLSYQNVFFNLLLAPIHQAVLFWIYYKALVADLRGLNSWKGRTFKS